MIKKTVIITGISGGIGSATAIKFAKMGWNIAGTFKNNSPERIVEEIKHYGVDCLCCFMDLNNTKSINSAFSSFRSHFKSIDCIVCNAGFNMENKLLIDVDANDISSLINGNLVGTALCNKLAVEILLQKKSGNIVNISSVLGIQGTSCEVIYSACKAGIIGLTKALASEVGQFDIRVNAVAPGMIETNMTKNFSVQEKNNIVSKTKLARLGKCDDIANATYFLASDDASFITGECLTVSGAISL